MDPQYVQNEQASPLRIEISIDHVFKLSQNRDEKSFSAYHSAFAEQDAGCRAIRCWK